MFIKDISFGTLETSPCHDRFQRMRIAYSMPKKMKSEIAKIRGAKNLSDVEKEQHIEQKLLNETKCHGYFFEKTQSMSCHYK